MTDLQILNASLITPEGITDSNLLINNGIIEQIAESSLCNSNEQVDAINCYVTPGLIDIHTHGGVGCNFLNCSERDIEKFKLDLLLHGVTLFLPTVMTAPADKMLTNIHFLTEYINNQSKFLPEALAINLEGPFLGKEYRGIHSSKELKALTKSSLEEFLTDAVRIITIAPELDQTGDIISSLASRGIITSIGHSAASYEDTNRAVDSGAKLVTHLYNAMKRFHHRSPGILTSALLNDVLYTEIIADGIHVHPAAIELAIKTKPEDRIILVSDSIALRDCPDLDYYVGEDKIHVEGNRAVNDAGVLSGSVLALDQSIRNLMRWGLVDFKQVIDFATANPARLLGLDNKIGSVAEGLKADLVIWNKVDLSIKATIVNGKCYWV